MQQQLVFKYNQSLTIQVNGPMSQFIYPLSVIVFVLKILTVFKKNNKRADEKQIFMQYHERALCLFPHPQRKTAFIQQLHKLSSIFYWYEPSFVDTKLRVCVQQLFAIVTGVILCIDILYECCGCGLRVKSEPYDRLEFTKTGTVMLITTPAHPCWLLLQRQFFCECSLTIEVKTEMRNEAGWAVHPDTQRHCYVLLC